MKLALFNAKRYDIESFNQANVSAAHELIFIEQPLQLKTARLASDAIAICIFVNDVVDSPLLEQLFKQGVRLICLRCAGYNNVDIAAAQALGIHVVHVPAYSPYAVAEHTLGLMLALNRHIPEANSRVHNGNFTINGLKGFDMHGKTAGIIGTGRIGALVACSLQALGMRVLAVDPIQNSACCNQSIEYVDMDTLLSLSDVISLHCPYTAENCHLINAEAISKMKKGVMIINTSRGGLLDTQAAIDGLRSGQIGYLGLDVYEREQNLFFQDLSDKEIDDADFKMLLSFPNVLITPHQAFFTAEAINNIASATLFSLSCFEKNEPLSNAILK